MQIREEQLRALALDGERRLAARARAALPALGRGLIAAEGLEEEVLLGRIAQARVFGLDAEEHIFWFLAMAAIYGDGVVDSLLVPWVGELLREPADEPELKAVLFTERARRQLDALERSLRAG